MLNIEEVPIHINTNLELPIKYKLILLQAHNLFPHTIQKNSKIINTKFAVQKIVLYVRRTKYVYLKKKQKQQTKFC